MQNITIKNNKVTNANAYNSAYENDSIATVNIVKNTKHTKKMCTNATVYKIMLNAQNAVAENLLANTVLADADINNYCYLSN